jgi:hypothetical protein
VALTQFQIVNADGTPGGTQVCEGRACYPTLQPGQRRVAGDGAASDTSATGGPPVTRVDPSGRLVHPQALLPPSAAAPQMTPQMRGSMAPPPQPAQVAEMPMPMAPQPMADPQRPDYVAPRITTPQPAAPVARMTPQPAMPVPGYPQGVMPQIAAPQMGNLPAQRTAQMPGQNAPSTGGYRPQVTQPDTGASAGPFGVQSPRADVPSQFAQRAFDSSGRAYADRGSHTSPLYDALRAKGDAMAARVRGMADTILGGAAAGGSSGYSSGGAYPSTSSTAYARQGKRMERASDRYYDALENPDPQKATGWAKRNLGKNKGNYPGILDDPFAMVALKGMGLDQWAQPGTADFWRSTPVADLAMIMGGSGRNDLTRPITEVKVPKILKGSIDPEKPDYKRELDYSKFAAQARDIFRGLGGQGANPLNESALLGQLANARNTGALRQGLEQQALYDVGGAADRAQGYFNSVFEATNDDMMAGVKSHLADKYFADAQAGMVNKKPEQFDRIVKDVAGRFGAPVPLDETDRTLNGRQSRTSRPRRRR